MNWFPIVISCVLVEWIDTKTVACDPHLVDITSNEAGRITEYDETNTKYETNQTYFYEKVKESLYVITDCAGTKKYKIPLKLEGFSDEGFYSKDNVVIENEDPQVTMTTPQLIALHGYPAEAHTIPTDDGYLLTLHRIPCTKYALNKRKRRTVLLHHGLFGSSADWVMAGPEKSLAYVLSDAGYDVWMANVRGNTYSKAHIKWNVQSSEFWNFTWHDISQHDLPAVIDYITSVKGPDLNLNYIGHSMGTTVLFALLSTKTEYNRKLSAGFALAPIAYMSHVKSPMRLLAPIANELADLLKRVGANEFLPHTSVLDWLSEHACELNHWEEMICENAMFVLCGYDESQFNTTLIPIILRHDPAGVSIKTVIHYAQEIHDGGRFQQYDYGAKGNLAEYGTRTPPQYDLGAVTLPIALFSGENDLLAGEQDVRKLFNELSNPIEHYVVPLKEFNHIDFLLAVDAPNLYYKKLLELLNQNYY